MRMAFACVGRLRIKLSKVKKAMSRKIKVSQEPDCDILLWKATIKVLQSIQEA